MPTPTAPTGYNFGGWYLDSSAVTSSTQNTTIGDHTLSASWTAKTYTVYKGGNMTGVSVSASSSGTFNTTLSFSTSGSSPGYNYSFSSMKIYSGSSTSGTLLATFTSTSASWTMTGTYYSSIYIYAEWSRSAIPTTITTSKRETSYRSTSDGSTSGSTTVTAGGGGGKWVYRITYWLTVKKNLSDTNEITTSKPPMITLSTTGETTSGITVTSTGKTYEAGANFLLNDLSTYWTYAATIRATSVYNGTYAEITLVFKDTNADAYFYGVDDITVRIFGRSFYPDVAP